VQYLSNFIRRKNEKSLLNSTRKVEMTSFSVDDLLAQATCAVLKDGEIVGTAWLVNDCIL